MTMRLMSRALQLAERGWYVFPLRPGDKRPLPGFHELGSTSDDEIRTQIIRWWAAAPYNIGIATGPSGLLVVDCDTARGDRSSSVASVGDGVEVSGHRLPKNLLCQHAKRWPASVLHCAEINPLATRPASLARISIRGVLAATSSVRDLFVQGASTWSLIVRPIAPLPTWITELLVPRRPSRPPVAPHERITSHYLRAILEGEVERVRSARPGDSQRRAQHSCVHHGSARWERGDHRRTRLVAAAQREPTCTSGWRVSQRTSSS